MQERFEPYKEKSRDYTIDVLRVIGTLLVILAHVSPPKMLSEIRTFDVSLLVFISGMSLAYSTYKGYWPYVKKRILKLCVPTYITICVVLALLIIGSVVSKSFSISAQYVFNSFFLIDANSIGFVWIVKVYLFTAFLTPVIKKVVEKIANPIIVFIVANAWMIGMSILIVYLPSNIITHEYIFYAVQYSAVAVMGLSYVKSSNRQKIVVLIVSGFAFVASQMLVGSFSPSEFKYPPQYYYLTYGVLVSIALHLLLSKIKFDNNDKIAKLICWMSTNSFTIYICHIYFMWGYFLLGKLMPNVSSRIGWLPLYLGVVIGACILCKLLELFQTKIKIIRGGSI